MELRQLSTFRMVAQTLSFSRTAIALNYVQSSVTAQIQALEEELGVRLFDRLGKRVALTDAGQRLLHYAEKILEQTNEARNAVVNQEIPTGTIVFSAPESLCTYRLPALLRYYHDLHPQVRLMFRPTLNGNDLKRNVSAGIVDVAFSVDEQLHSNALRIETLIPEPLQIVVSSSHPLAICPIVCAEDLEGEQFLLTEKGCTYRNIIESALNEAGVDAITDLEFNSIEAIKQCTITGMGIAFLPAFTVANEIVQGKLVALQWGDHYFEATTQMLWHKEKWISPALQAFLEAARTVININNEQQIEELYKAG